MPKNEALLATAGDWIYVSCHTIVKLGRTGVTLTSDGGVCALCANSNVRFVHTLESASDLDAGKEPREIQVGIDCAAELVHHSDAHIPRVAENEVRRKEKWRKHYRKPGRCITTIDDLDQRGKL